jgi:hypothetical protein
LVTLKQEKTIFSQPDYKVVIDEMRAELAKA